MIAGLRARAPLEHPPVTDIVRKPSRPNKIKGFLVLG